MLMTQDRHLANKRALHEGLRRLATAPGRTRTAVLRELFHPNVQWHGSHPINDLAGLEALEDGLWQPLERAMPDLERRDDILMAGTWEGKDWVAATGHYVGTFAAPLFDIPATRGIATLRYGEFYHVVEGRVAEVYVILDFVDLMRQAGVMPLPKSPGAEGYAPPPATLDGVLLRPGDEAVAEDTMRVLLAMFTGLGSFDGRSLESMAMERYWTPTMMWYGPCGIGATRGVKGFQVYHQGPFLKAFPDRRGGGHKARFCDLMYAASTGWPSVVATHTGPYLGTPATGRRIGMRVMDFWRREGDLLAENWVFIDLPELFLQFDVDLFAIMRGLR